MASRPKSRSLCRRARRNKSRQSDASLSKSSSNFVLAHSGDRAGPGFVIPSESGIARVEGKPRDCNISSAGLLSLSEEINIIRSLCCSIRLRKYLIIVFQRTQQISYSADNLSSAGGPLNRSGAQVLIMLSIVLFGSRKV